MLILTYNPKTAKWQVAAQTTLDGVTVFELIGKECNTKVEALQDYRELYNALKLRAMQLAAESVAAKKG